MTLPDAVSELIEGAVERGVVPGAAAASAGRDGPGPTLAHGVRRVAGPAVTEDTRFDLASLTKVVATLPSVLRLVAEGDVGLDDRLAEHFSNAGWHQNPSLGDTTVRQLLAHSSGVEPWWPLFARVSSRAAALGAVLQSRVEAPGVARYSDISYMILGALVERVTKRRLDEFARDAVLGPLGMEETSFGPLRDVPVAATEDCGWRNRLLEGEVHDENASVWDGVAGHAGLFGTARDVAMYAAAWLRLDPRLGPEPLLREAVSLQAAGNDGTRRGLGWVLAHESVFAGRHARGFGHTGFTGTSMWLDSAAGTASVLLTNRVHPHRANGAGIADLRAAFHTLAHRVPA